MKQRRRVCVVDQRLDENGQLRDHYVDVGHAEFPTGEHLIVATLRLEGTMRTRLLILRDPPKRNPKE